MRKYYLDTNICVEFLRGRNQHVSEKIKSFPPSDIKVPLIVVAELVAGAFKSVKREKNLGEIKYFYENFEIVPFEFYDVFTYGKIRAGLELKGQKIGTNDTIIAAVVLSRNGILVTNNVKEFSRVENLIIEDWTCSS